MEQWYVDTMTTRAEWVSSLIQAYIIICIFIALLHPSSPCPSLSPVFSSFSTTSGGVTIPAVSSNSFALATNTYLTASTFPNLNIPSGTFSILASVYNDCGYGGASWASNPGGIGATLTCNFNTPYFATQGNDGSCSCNNYCASNWWNEISIHQPTWSGATCAMAVTVAGNTISCTATSSAPIVCYCVAAVAWVNGISSSTWTTIGSVVGCNQMGAN